MQRKNKRVKANRKRHPSILESKAPQMKQAVKVRFAQFATFLIRGMQLVRQQMPIWRSQVAEAWQGLGIKDKLRTGAQITWDFIVALELQQKLISAVRWLARRVKTLPWKSMGRFLNVTLHEMLRFGRTALTKLKQRPGTETTATSLRGRLRYGLRFFNPSVVRQEAPQQHFFHTLLITGFFISVTLCALAAAKNTDKLAAIADTLQLVDTDSTPDTQNDSDSGGTGSWFAEEAEEPSAENESRQPASDKSTGSWIDLDSAYDKPAKIVKKKAADKGAWIDLDNAYDTPRDADAVRNDTPAVSDPPGDNNAAEATGNAGPDFSQPFYLYTHVPAKSVDVYPMVAAPGIEIVISHMLEPESAAEKMVAEDARIKGVKRQRVDSDLTYTIWTKKKIKTLKSDVDGNVITITPVR